MGKFDLFFHAFAFYSWVRYVRKRMHWKQFSQFHNSLSYNTELAYGTLMELRSPDSNEYLLPNGTGISLELSIKAKRDIENGITPKYKSSSEDPTDSFSVSPLLRSFLLVLHKKIDFDVFTPQQADKFKLFRNEEDLFSQLERNTEILLRNMKHKMCRDSAVIAGIDAHISFQDYNKVNSLFTIRELPTIYQIQDDSFVLQPIKVYDEAIISANALISVIKKAPPEIDYKLRERKKKSISNLHQRIRSPMAIISSSRFSITEPSNDRNSRRVYRRNKNANLL